MNGKSLFYGMLAGGIIGGAVTLLSTPKSGNDMKQSLYNNVDSLKKTLKNATTKTMDMTAQVQTVAQESAKTLKTVSNDVKESLVDWKHDVEPTIHDIQKSIRELHDTIDQLETEIKKPLLNK